MGFYRVVKKVFNPLLNVSGNIDYERISGFARYLIEMVKFQFVPQQAKRKESFTNATTRLKLTETDLNARQRIFFWLAYLYLMLALVVFAYATYLFVQDGPIGGALSVVIGLILMGHAFRKRLWYFQVKTRHLGYSFSEWCRLDLLRGGSRHEKK